MKKLFFIFLLIPILAWSQITTKAGETPLFVLDGTIVSEATINDIDTNNIDYVNVIKNDSLVEKYGEKAKNGVVEIYTKDFDGNSGNAMNNQITEFQNEDGTVKLIVLDGIAVSMDDLSNYDPKNIERIKVLKGSEATEKYGEDGNNGVIELYSKFR